MHKHSQVRIRSIFPAPLPIVFWHYMNAVEHLLSAAWTWCQSTWKNSDLVEPESNYNAGVFVFRWLARLWNAVVVPRVEEAIISRVTTKRFSSSSTASSSSSSLQRPSPSNCGLSPGQQAVVKAALSILVNKAVLVGCPLTRQGEWASQMMLFMMLSFQSWTIFWK